MGVYPGHEWPKMLRESLMSCAPKGLENGHVCLNSQLKYEHLAQICSIVRGSSHIRSVLIGVEYQNCCRTLDVYLLVAIWI